METETWFVRPFLNFYLFRLVIGTHGLWLNAEICAGVCSSKIFIASFPFFIFSTILITRFDVNNTLGTD